MIIKNEIPILEYDDASKEVISPKQDVEELKLPKKCLIAFLSECVEEYAKAHNATIAEEIITFSHVVKIYILHEGDEDICLIQPTIGSAAAVQALDVLIACGCEKIIAVGSCGVLADLPENAFLVPTKALRADGTSYHYLPASRYVELDGDAIKAIERCFTKHDLPFVTTTTWTTDGFYRETKDMVKYRLEEGCEVVEMECAGMAACAKKRGAKFGQFLFTADSLANVHEYDTRDWGLASHEKALLLGLEVLREFN